MWLRDWEPACELKGRCFDSSQGTCIGCGPGPQSMFLSSSFSFPPHLSKNKKNKIFSKNIVLKGKDLLASVKLIHWSLHHWLADLAPFRWRALWCSFDSPVLPVTPTAYGIDLWVTLITLYCRYVVSSCPSPDLPFLGPSRTGNCLTHLRVSSHCHRARAWAGAQKMMARCTSAWRLRSKLSQIRTH